MSLQSLIPSPSNPRLQSQRKLPMVFVQFPLIRLSRWVERFNLNRNLNFLMVWPSLSFEMTIVGMFFAFIDIKAILPITNKPYTTFTLECPVIIMALKWFLKQSVSCFRMLFLKPGLSIDMTLMAMSFTFVNIQTSFSTWVKSVNTFTRITTIGIFACCIWIACIFNRFTKDKNISI